MADQPIRRLLSKIGFSEKEIDVYLATIERGEATVTEITESVDISTRYAYDITEQLAERDVVVLNDHDSPTTIRAIDPEEAIGNLVDELESVESELKTLFTAPEPVDVEFDIIQTDETARRRLIEIIEEATDELVIALPHSRYGGFADVIETAAERGVSVLLLLEDNLASSNPVDHGGPLTVIRRHDAPLPLMVGADAEVGMIGPPGSFTGSDSGRSIVTVRQSQLVGTIVGSFLSNYWPLGEEMYVAEGTPLPATFEHFRSAVLDATLHQRTGCDLSASVTARPMMDDENESTIEKRTLTGDIVEIRQNLVVPTTNMFPIEASLILDTNEGRVSVGGKGALVEDYEALELTLDTAGSEGIPADEDKDT